MTAFRIRWCCESESTELRRGVTGRGNCGKIEIERAGSARAATPAGMKTIVRKACGWGGWRPGAGRKPKGAVAGAPHRRLPRVGWSDEVLVRWKVVAGGPDLAREPQRGCVRAIVGACACAGFRVEGFALEPATLWVRVRGRSRRALKRGLSTLAVRVARGLNRRLGRVGKLFADRNQQWLVAELARGPRRAAQVRILRVLEPLAERARAV